MKKYLLLIWVVLGGLSPAKAESPEGNCYIMAIAFPDRRPVPASLRFSVREGKDMAELRVNGVTRVAPVVIRELPQSGRNPLQKIFDAVFVSTDQLSSLVVTGRFFDFSRGSGDGLIALHSAAVISKEAGSPTTPASLLAGTFSMEKLDNHPGESSEALPSN